MLLGYSKFGRILNYRGTRWWWRWWWWYSHFRAFGAEQILKIAINAEERKRRQSLAQISSEFDLLRLIQTALIQW